MTMKTTGMVCWNAPIDMDWMGEFISYNSNEIIQKKMLVLAYIRN